MRMNSKTYRKLPTTREEFFENSDLIVQVTAWLVQRRDGWYSLVQKAIVPKSWLEIMCIVLDDYLCATENLDGQKESLFYDFRRYFFVSSPSW